MILGIMLDADVAEEQMLFSQLRELSAYYTDEKLEIKIFQKSSLMQREVEQLDFLDMALLDVTLPEALESAKKIRQQFTKAEILIIANQSISPVQYMHPSIRASALLMRPMTAEWKMILKDFFGQLAVVERKMQPEENEILWINNREGTFRIPFSQIYYLEAREKKIFVRTRMEEFGLSGTMEKMMEQLPDQFKRCHRSFVVNTNHIVKVKLSENLLYLENNLFVPVSRSYRGAFKRHINE